MFQQASTDELLVSELDFINLKVSVNSEGVLFTRKISVVLAILTLLCMMLFTSCAETHTHKFGEWTVQKKPTCTEDGMQEKLCSCGEKLTQIIPATHSFDAGKIVKASTCTEEGTKRYTCSVCGTTKDEPVSKISHIYDSGNVTAVATCSHSGTKTFTCIICGQTKAETIAQLPHEYDYGKVSKEATCTQYGTMTFTCTTCGSTWIKTIAALGHNLDSKCICHRCGEKCPVSLDMTTLEKSNASKVAYISQRQIYHDDKNNEFRLQFSLLDSNQQELATAAVVAIEIVNDKNEIVYSATKTVSYGDFGKWTRTLTGADYLLATVYIKDSEITPGKSSKGTVRFTVFNADYFAFEESTLSTNGDLPIKSISVTLPTLPTTISYYGYSGKYSSCKVTSISYEVNGDDLYLYFDVEKTYDREGSGHSDSCMVAWKLYDAEGYVVDTGTFYSDSLKVGERVRGSKEYAFNCVEPGGEYRLEILDVKY